MPGVDWFGRRTDEGKAVREQVTRLVADVAARYTRFGRLTEDDVMDLIGRVLRLRLGSLPVCAEVNTLLNR